RAKLARGAQYGALLAAAAAVGLLADWGEVKDAFFNLDVARDQFPDVITTALVNTVTYTALGFAFGLALGLLLALMKLSSVAPNRWLATVYIELFRGV